MNFENTWCVIERNNRFETISHEEITSLQEGSYVMIQNFDTHHEAQQEHKRLLMMVINDAKKKLKHFKN